MYSFLAKNGQALAFGLGMLLVILFMLIAFPNTEGVQDFTDAEKYNSSIFDFGLIAAIGLTVIAAIGMVLFGVVQLAGSFKSSWKGVAGFAVIIVVFLIAYSSVDTNVSPYIQAAIDKFESSDNVFTDGNLKFISASVTTALATLAIAAVSLVGSLVYNFFK